MRSFFAVRVVFAASALVLVVVIGGFVWIVVAIAAAEQAEYRVGGIIVRNVDILGSALAA